jgi:alanine-synthesizing transaminase
MFMWAPVPEQFREIGSLEFAKLLLEKAQVAVSPGIGFGPLGEGHVRFALVENEHRIRQATRSIAQFLKGPGAGGQGPGIGDRPLADVIESDRVR